MLTNGVKGIVQLVFVVTTSFLVALLYLSFATVTSKVAPGAKGAFTYDVRFLGRYTHAIL